MKKLLLIVSLLLSLVLLLSGCNNAKLLGGDNTSNPPDNKAELTIKDYYAYKDNTKYVYEGHGMEYASYYVYVDYISGDRVQLRSNNGGTEMVKVLENKDGELRMLLSRGEAYYRENLTQATGSNVEILLKEPLAVGTSWNLSDGRKRSITNLEVDVTTPSGTYKTLEVTTEGKDSKVLDYYAPNVGLVKTVFTSNGTEVTSALSKVETNAPLTQTVRFYYPNANVDKLYFVDKQLTFKTNDITKAIFEQAFKDLPKGDVANVLGPNVKINSLYLNQDNRVYVDFSKEFVSEMNAGSSYESLILKSITNTLGGYYGVDKVHITIEGKPYESGHFALKKEEYFTVDFNNSEQLK